MADQRSVAVRCSTCHPAPGVGVPCLVVMDTILLKIRVFQLRKGDSHRETRHIPLHRLHMLSTVSPSVSHL